MQEDDVYDENFAVRPNDVFSDLENDEEIQEPPSGIQPILPINENSK